MSGEAPSEISKIILFEDSLLFKSLDDEGRGRVMEEGRLRKFERGAVIFREGEPGDAFYLIKNGSVRVTTAMSGDPVELATLTRGSVLGEVAVLHGKPRTATAEAVSDVSALWFSKALIDEIIGTNPRFRALLEAVILGRARDTIEKIIRRGG
jgi:CRP-like cAMP-binding protein